MQILGIIAFATLLATGCGTDTSVTSRNRPTSDRPLNGSRDLDDLGRVEGTGIVIEMEEPEIDPNQPVATAINVDAEFLEEKKVYKFTNHSDGSLWYTGYGTNSPLYIFEGREEASAQDETKWQSLVGWCGVGLKYVELKQNESLEVIPYYSYIKDNFAVVRVAITFLIVPQAKSTTIYGPVRPGR